MKLSLKSSRRSLYVAAAVALALVTWLWPYNTKPSQKDLQTMQKFTQNMTTHCVGRFLIEAPAGADTGEGSYGLRIAAIKPIQKSTQAVEDRLRRLERELAQRVAAQSTWKDLYGDPVLPARLFQPGAQIRSILYGEPDSSNTSSDKLDGYVVRPGGTFVFWGRAHDDEHIKEFNDFLLEIEPTLSVRENSVIPTTPGFCMNGGFIAMNPKRGERADWGWKLLGHPDVYFGLSISSNGKSVDSGILDREANILKEIKAAMGAKGMGDLKTLRKRRFDLNGRAAQEWLREITDDAPAYDFGLEIPGKPNDLSNPSINLSLRVGGSSSKGHVKPSLTPGEAMALWDAVIQTLRLRPGAF